MPEMNEYEEGTPCWVDMGTSDLQGAGASWNRWTSWKRDGCRS